MPKSGNPYPVTFAYLISASKGDVQRLTRVLRALYHPGNYYLIHVDYDAPESEHLEIAKFVSSEAVLGRWLEGLTRRSSVQMLPQTVTARVEDIANAELPSSGKLGVLTTLKLGWKTITCGITKGCQGTEGHRWVSRDMAGLVIYSLTQRATSISARRAAVYRATRFPPPSSLS
ncbi:core-2/I-branching beta-1,6-N-acetylglucosaminyltransferase family protein [Actinidia rufa]|uniref:Core-2/I-branching beta-1,6-N-acetylglucosaminyltransferase family protein n=1 Tax=Actinidia rufa TaxID=165716 RepID=A0A7J0GF35_9ERIC|nr:core-2/I-branching beta-1,6-N-acetylglucosaminyltransferase family protein [Actinidia rufa]